MSKIELLPRTLDMLIPKVLAGGRRYGFLIAQRIHARSQDVLPAEEGTP